MSLQLWYWYGIDYGIAHLANSGAIIDLPESYLDMVRPGISLYGYFPSLDTTECVKLKPVMSLISKVASVSVFKPNTPISYGRLYRTSDKEKIVSIGFGYADGFIRRLTNKASSIINGKLCRQVGRVTMDRVMFSVGRFNVKVGDEVVILGQRGKLKIDAWDWGKILKTIPYEITCNISKRVPRVYIRYEELKD